MNAERIRLRTKSLLLMFAVPLAVMMALIWLFMAPVQGAAIAGDTPDAPGSISGQVTNGDGEPLSGIEVALYRQTYESTANVYLADTTTTDATGAYGFDLLSTGIYHVGFVDPAKSYAPEFYDNAAMLDDAAEILIGGQTVAGIDAVLERGGAISGVVSLASPGAKVYWGAVGIFRFTDASRKNWELIDFMPVESFPVSYTMEALAPGLYFVCANVGLEYSYEFECYEDASRETDATALEVTTDEQYSSINIVLGDGSDLGSISGTVVDAGGEPVEGIQLGWSTSLPVEYFPATSLSAVDGTFTVTTVVPGTYYAAFYDPQGRYFTSPYVDSTTGEPLQITVERFGGVTGVDGILEPASWITGSVTVRDGIPAMYAFAVAYRLNTGEPEYPGYPIYQGETEVSETGFYTITRLLPGDYFVEAYAQNYDDFFYGVYSLDGMNPMTIPVASADIVTGIDIELAPDAYEGVVSGTVTADGEPQAGKRVDLYTYSYYDYSGVLPPLVPAPEGGSVDGAEAEEISGRIYYTTTGTDGTYRVEGAASGREYAAWFSDPDRRYASVCSDDPAFPYACSFRYLDGISNTVEINADLVEGATVKGRISLPPGERPEDYFVQAYWLDIYNDDYWGYEWIDHSLAVRSAIGADGRYELPGLYPGEYRIAVRYAWALTWGLDDGLIQAYPNVISLYDAAPITVEAGEERAGIDFLLAPSERRYLPFAGR